MLIEIEDEQPISGFLRNHANPLNDEKLEEHLNSLIKNGNSVGLVFMPQNGELVNSGICVFTMIRKKHAFGLIEFNGSSRTNLHLGMP